MKLKLHTITAALFLETHLIMPTFNRSQNSVKLIQDALLTCSTAKLQ